MKSFVATLDLAAFSSGVSFIHTLHLSREDVDNRIGTPSPVFLDLLHLLRPSRKMENSLISRTLPVRITAHVHGSYFDPG